MSEIDNLRQIKDLTPVEIQTSVHNWLKIADTLEEVGHAKWEAGNTTVKEEQWVFEIQMADQIRFAVVLSDPK